MADEVKRTFDLTDADYERSIGIMVLHQKASASFLQRTMSLGYNAAASLMERAEKDGFVSRAANSGKRNVLIGLPEIAKLRADLANAGAVMVEAALRLPAYDSDGDPAGQFDHHVFVRRDDLRALSTLSPIAAAAGLVADGIDADMRTFNQCLDEEPATGETKAGHFFAQVIRRYARAEAADAETLEQARLLGMGAERELALMAKADRWERMADRLAEVMNDIRDYATILASDGQHRVLREVLAAHAAMKEGR